MSHLATHASALRILEQLEVLASNAAEVASKVATVDAMAVSLSSLNAANQSSLRQWSTYLDTRRNDLTTQRRLVDTAVSRVESAIESLKSIVEGGGLTYSAAVDQLNELRDKFVSFYLDYADLSIKLGSEEDSSVIQHLMSVWDEAHGTISGFMSSYQDSYGDAVGDHVVEWNVPDNRILYRFTSRDVAAGATAQKLYTPGRRSTPQPVTGSVLYERCSSPYKSPSGVDLDWILYLPPQMRNGCFQKFVFMSNGSPGVHRWQYQYQGSWRTLADVSSLNTVQFYAPFDRVVELDLLEYGGTATAKVSYKATITRTRYGGYLRLEPVGPLYPMVNQVFHAPLRCLIMNGPSLTGHREVVDTLSERMTFTQDGTIVYVQENGQQYKRISGSWVLSGPDEIVDEINFTGVGIMRRNCVFE